MTHIRKQVGWLAAELVNSVAERRRVFGEQLQAAIAPLDEEWATG
ncbi:MAG: hypothetical protein OSA81_04995 [Longimicrobiales bacterium]|nr:hypothetical protein [Longimicrobiales bacterium]